METDTGEVLLAEGFDGVGASSGWSIFRTGAGPDGFHLGRFTTEVVEKRIAVPTGVAHVTIEFDFLEIDSWDGEIFSVLINGQQIDIGSFNWQSDEAAAAYEAEGGIQVERAAAQDISAGDSTSFWAFNDNLHKVKLTIPNPGESLTLGFTSTLDQASTNESFGIDNLRVVAFPETEPLLPVVPQGPHIDRLLFAEYFDIDGPVSSLADVDFTGSNRIEVVNAINFHAGEGGFYEGGPTDNFAVRFSNSFEITESGAYTFYLTSDDGSQLRLGGRTVLGNDGLHAAREESATLDLTAGWHSFQVLYFEAGGQATLDLDWSGPSFHRQQMTFGDKPEPEPDVPGSLAVEYFALPGGVGSLSQIDFDAEPAATGNLSEINFNVGNGAFYDGGPSDNFAARFTGTFEAGSAGSYTFFLNSDDGSVLFIDGQQVLGNDGLHAAREESVTLDLSEGAHNIELRYFEAGGDAVLNLDWAGPGFGREQMRFVDTTPAATFEYVTPEEDLKALYPDMASISSDELADHINNSRAWENGTITYSFPTYESPDYIGNGREGTLFGFGEGQQSLTREIMSYFDEIIAFDVVDMGDSQDAGIRLWNSTLQRGVFAGGLPGDGIRGDMWAYGQNPDAPNYNTKWLNNAPGDATYQIMLHEIGHTMGLDHTPLREVQDGEDVEFETVSQHLEGSKAYSQMSYWNYDFIGLTRDAPEPGTMMLADITALQTKYGANMETRTGDSVYGFNSNVERDVFNYEKMLADKGWTAAFTIWDAGGNDTIDMSGFTQGSFISLIDGTYSSTGGFDMNVAIARNAIIENAIGGSGDDKLIGNAVANVLEGLEGNDLLVGNDGDDLLRGGAGDDEISGGRGADTLEGGAGIDILSGGADGDVFHFAAGSGLEVVMDFDVAEDILRFEGTAVGNVADLSFRTATVGTSVDGYVLTENAIHASYGDGADGDTVVLLGVGLAEIELAGFVFA